MGAAYPLTISFHVSVRRDHVAKGVRESCLLCPVARAVHEQWPTDAPRFQGESSVVVNPTFVSVFVRGGELYQGRLPEPVTQFITAFDAAALLSPEGPEFDLTMRRFEAGASAHKLLLALEDGPVVDSEFTFGGDLVVFESGVIGRMADRY